MANLSLKNINKVYQNNTQVVFDFNLDIEDREFVVLVGPSGCGKSTTLRMIAGLEEITSGELDIDGRLVNDVIPQDRDVAMVFQNYALFPHMTVKENMSYSLRHRKLEMPVYEKNPKIDEAQKEIKKLFSKIHHLEFRMKSKKAPERLYQEKDALLEKVEALLKTIEGEQVPILGKDAHRIKRCEEAIRVLGKQIEADEKTLQNASDQEESLYLKESIKGKKEKLERIKNDLEYLQSNDLPLTKFRKPTGTEIEIRVNRAAKILGLDRYIMRKPGPLSGGQRQRVAIGRSIVRNPKLFLMDEPLSNLDAKLRIQTRQEIKKIHERVGATTVYVTHDQTEAMTMASRIVVMKDGYVQQIGTPKEVYNDPVNKFVAGFIGVYGMNFAEVVVHDGKAFFSDDVSIDLGEENAKLLSAYEGAEVILGMRPEALCVGKGEGEGWTGSLSVAPEIVEDLGSEYLIHFSVAGKPMTVADKSKTVHHGCPSFEVCFRKDAMLFFDAETELRIR